MTPVARKPWKFPWIHLGRQNGYSMLQVEEGLEGSTRTKGARFPSWSSLLWSQALITLFLCVAACIAGFSAGQHVERTQNIIRECPCQRLYMYSSSESNPFPRFSEPKVVGFQEPVRILLESFQFNPAFSAAPSNESNRAWERNLPRKYADTD